MPVFGTYYGWSSDEYGATATGDNTYQRSRHRRVSAALYVPLPDVLVSMMGAGCYSLLLPVTWHGFRSIFAPRLLPSVHKRLLSVYKLFPGLSPGVFPAPSLLRLE